MKRILIIGLLFIHQLVVHGQQAPKPYGVLPTTRQLNWQETEMYCLIHFGLATVTDKEWGYGDEDAKRFNPTKFDAMKIVAAAKSGGFKGIIVVAKHHDGFALWPTKTTPHNITASDYKNGKGDMIKAYQLACEKLGMKMGIYCSPWDRNSPVYGSKAYVTDVYREQLKELYQNYGPLFMSWHDGANGGDGYYGGAREVRKIDRSTYYGWDKTWAITRKMQPNAAIFGDVGPDVRWVGNEEGHAGETSWATYTPQAPEAGKRPANGFVKSEEGVEGTRNGAYWMPAECDVPLRPGWFYHQAQDGLSKSPYALLDLYYKSVGRGACLDLGLSPNKDGELTAEDRSILSEFGNLLHQIFKVNLAKGATFTASNIRGNNILKFGPGNLTDQSRYTYWATNNGVQTPQLIIDLHQTKTFNVIRLRENIKLGQRIAGAAIDCWSGAQWQQIAGVTSIGANRLIRFPKNVSTRKLRLRITASPVCIALSDFGLFMEPEHLSIPIVKRNAAGQVSIVTEAPVQAIHYTLDGSMPTPQSQIYTNPISYANGGEIKAISRGASGKASALKTARFGLIKTGWKIVSANASIVTNGNKAIDDNPATIWSFTKTDPTDTPQEIVVDMGKTQTIKAFTYLPRQDKNLNGIVDRYSFWISQDGQNWKQVAEGEFANIKANPVEQAIPVTGTQEARFFKLVAKSVVSGPNMTAAEVGVMEN